MDQTYFVIASYTISALAIGGLTLWIFISARRAFHKVNQFEKSNG